MKVIKAHPQNAEAYYNRGVVYSYFDRYESAIFDYGEAAKLYREQRNIEGYQKAVQHINRINNLGLAD